MTKGEVAYVEGEEKIDIDVEFVISDLGVASKLGV